MADNVTNERLTDDAFHAQRETIFREQLGRAPYDLDEALAFSLENAKRGTVAAVLQKAKATGVAAVVPRAGVASWEGQRALMQMLDEAGAAYLPITIDSLTRELQFAEAERRRNRLRRDGVVEHAVARDPVDVGERQTRVLDGAATGDGGEIEDALARLRREAGLPDPDDPDLAVIPVGPRSHGTAACASRRRRRAPPGGPRS